MGANRTAAGRRRCLKGRLGPTPLNDWAAPRNLRPTDTSAPDSSRTTKPPQRVFSIAVTRPGPRLGRL